MKVHIDIETYSDISLPDVGAYRYAEDPSTELLLVSWAIEDGPVQTWDLVTAGDSGDLEDLMADPSVEWWAHNAAFERVLLRRLLPGHCPPIERWRCTMAWAHSLGLPAALDDLAAAVDSPMRKTEDKCFVKTMTTPIRGGYRKHENLWPQFIEYNRMDVETEREVHRRLSRYPMPASEWTLWHLDQRINDNGLPIDLHFVKAADRMAQQAAREADHLIQTYGIDNPRSRDQVLAFLAEQGHAMPDLRKGTVDSVIAAGDLVAAADEVMRARREMTSASVRKYAKLLEATCGDGRMRGTLQFHGAARTGRWSGRLFQPQNLPRGSLKTDADIAQARELVLAGDAETIRLIWGDVAPVLASLVRSAIAAPDGCTLVSADFASIESVMLAWLADCKPLLQVFHTGKDAYKDFGTRLFGVAYDAITKPQRTISKPAVLGCGYGMGPPALVSYADGMGITLTIEEAERHVGAFRRAYPEIPRLWYATWDAVESAMEGQPSEAGRCSWFTQGPFLRCSLPSGRCLSYYRPKLQDGRHGMELSYDNGSQGRVSTHGAKLVGNITQAVARDVLAHTLLQLPRDRIVGHVHDEGILLVPESAGPKALATTLGIMGHAPPWCADAPIKAAGWHGKLYRKD